MYKIVKRLLKKLTLLIVCKHGEEHLKKISVFSMLSIHHTPYNTKPPKNLQRESTYSSVRMGIYEPIKDVLLAGMGTPNLPSGDGKKKQPDPPVVKFAASFLSGAIGSALFNPVDLVKVRFQSNLPSDPMPYDGKVVRAFSTIYSERGLSGLYSGRE